MKLLKFAFSICLIILSLQSQAQELSNFFTQTDAFLKQNVKNGLVNYQGIKGNSTDLDKLIQQIETQKLAGKTALEKKAFYINAYNILVIKSVVANYPLKSPLDVAGFFDVKKHKIAGENLTLNDIENKKLRAIYNDARIHFVLVCAAKGCPKIVNYAYLPEKLNVQLNIRTRFAINNSNFIRVDKSNKKVLVSEIFKWYEKDFLSKATPNIIAYLNQFRKEKIAPEFSMDYYTYDWKLNKQ